MKTSEIAYQALQDVLLLLLESKDMSEIEVTDADLVRIHRTSELKIAETDKGIVFRRTPR
jgi:hypothetical protein